MDGCPRVSAILYVDHEQGKKEEAEAHAEADPVHSLVANENITVSINVDSTEGGVGTAFT